MSRFPTGYIGVRLRLNLAQGCALYHRCREASALYSHLSHARSLTIQVFVQTLPGFGFCAR
jgi:hypothetical protein